MPVPPTATHIRLNKVVTSMNAAVTTLGVISESMETPFLQPILNTLHSVDSCAACQTVQRNKDECTQMLEQIHELIYAIIWVHLKSDTAGELSPTMLNNLGKFTETIYKIHTYVEAEQEKSKIKQFFQQGEMRTLLKACHTGLEQALEVFKISRVFLAPITRPKIFHGRELEVSMIIQQLNQPIPRVAILGGGGMGKTSLARAILHRPETTAKYQQHCFFVAADAASSSVHLAALIGAHVGLQSGQDLTEPVVQYFTCSHPSLLILDNLETGWEPKESRADVEKLLGLLEDIEHLTLIITMRGAERPANVR
ncbi:hypothetical protein FB451DRAFT_1479022 [Mycena latifolia]|nr:hypothetical protein FB451DRAFT_1479022 [Mycena latifolia]